ncbi:type 3 dihydrofolate reductase [Photobacterium damselae]|uniref:Dihydrofolate reductase n=1 Tax=Photobacterium damselae TaxID=38293 RepID=A0ABD6X0H1_PHODM|nr:type 3 dihydrofolate reductase [Photobacterium damselae]OBU45106.1 diacylglycerol kinase [Photobacterium damselae]PSU15647.1 type 3 dihydrofolate reductase [Photobacterium damselae]
MKISMIAAMAKDRVIGKDNAMPWHLPADFAWFKQSTLGKPIVMGRKTYQSIGRPLPGRLNIVISRDPQLTIEGVTVVNSLEQAKMVAGEVEELMIIGGGSIYEHYLAQADCLYLTFIEAQIEGDTRFPDWGEGWLKTYSEHYTADENNAYDMEFVILQRS